MATPAQDIAQALNAEALARLEASAAGLTAPQLMWASGYLAGLAAAGEVARAPAASPAAVARGAAGLTVLYATETGNSRRVAGQLAESARAQGVTVKVEDLSRYKPRQLKREKRVALVTATHGLGDPPDGTEAFFEFLFSDDAPRLEGLEFSVLALGDSSYDDFCAIGRRIDERLEALGGSRVHERIDCDLDFDDEAARWSTGLLERLSDGADSAANVTVLPQIHAVPDTAYSRARPFQAAILENQKITGRDSTKDVRHFELSLEESGLRYEPGDSLGVLPHNPVELIDELLELTGYDGDNVVRLAGEAMTLHSALRQKLEITVAGRGFADAYAGVSESMPALPRTPESKAWLDRRQLIDIVAEHAPPEDPQLFVECLRKLTPRLYSIASSPDANPDEVHLTVRMVDYTAFGRRHWGAASSFLGYRDSVPVYVEPNERFRLPADPDTPIIMIGPGTGVAPFRAFVEHRMTHGASGRNWLFFGDRTQRSDFLYQLEWLRYRRDGVLHKLDTAFSRDLDHKVYVQDRIRQRGEELYDWIETGGAHVYVCGDADDMAPAVHAALREVVGSVGGVDDDTAEAYLKKLRQDGRYKRDVY